MLSRRCLQHARAYCQPRRYFSFDAPPDRTFHDFGLSNKLYDGIEALGINVGRPTAIQQSCIPLGQAHQQQLWACSTVQVLVEAIACV